MKWVQGCVELRQADRHWEGLHFALTQAFSADSDRASGFGAERWWWGDRRSSRPHGLGSGPHLAARDTLAPEGVGTQHQSPPIPHHLPPVVAWGKHGALQTLL